MGPIILLEAIIQLASGTSFFREIGNGSGDWFTKTLSNFEVTGTYDSSGLGFDIGLILTGFLSFLFMPIAEAAILFSIHHIRCGEEFTVGAVIKQAFSRFWPILGSSILFGLISCAIVLIPIAIIAVIGGVMATLVNPIVGILLGIVLFLGAAIGIGLLLTRWSFYFGSVVLDRESPGFGKSWRLSKKQSWVLMGLYIVFYLIISSISFAVELTFTALLGNSVLLTMISNIVSLFTTLIFAVGYGVMYLDLKIRNDADDLKEMIADYETI